jgi:hypothetical protein
MINSKVQLHIQQSLSFSGLVVLEKTLMLYLRPDLWVAGHETDLHWAPIENYLRGLSPRVKVFEVRFEGRGSWARVAARSDDQLAERATWITGLAVLEIREYKADEPAAGTVYRRPVDEIPDYPCQARTDALAKRGLPDRKFPAPGPVRKGAS